MRDVCFHCGGKLIWDSDFSADDVFDDGDTDGIVHRLHCANCGADVQYVIHSKGAENDG